MDYTESLRCVQEWWQQEAGYSPVAVPAAAKLPMYSTWYSFHQQVSPEEIEQQCRLAKELGCGGVIVDDGWQTRTSPGDMPTAAIGRPAAPKCRT